jgi:hypothetical protein
MPLASIEASLEFYIVESSRVSILPESSLLDLLSRCFAKFTRIFNIDDSHAVLSSPAALERMVDAIFDTQSRAFITENSLPMIAGLDDQAKACLLSQAIAGLVLIFRRLASSGVELSHGRLSKELQLFSESEQRQNMLEKIEGSHVLVSCATRNQLVSLLKNAVEDTTRKHHDELPLSMLGEDLLNDGVAWVSDRPCRNMGLPWGFTIMAIN